MTRHIRILIAGAVMILAGNAIALIDVVYNRSGKPDAVVEFSERELARPYNYLASKENSGLALHLNWSSTGAGRPVLPGILSQGGSGGSPWLDKDKLAVLGFDVSGDPHDPKAMRRYQKALPRKAYVVLQFNGTAYQGAVQQARQRLDEAKAKQAADPDNALLKRALEYAQRQLDNEQHKSSRLFAVDVGPDQESLRTRYPDRARYIILPGQVRLTGFNGAVNGYITGLDVNTINVPLAYRAAISGGRATRPAHYTVRLAFGKRAEPWILAAHPGEEGDSSPE